MKKLFFGFLLLVAQGCATLPKGEPGRNTACDSVVRDKRLARVANINALNEVTTILNNGKDPSSNQTRKVDETNELWMAKITEAQTCLTKHQIADSSIPWKNDEEPPTVLELNMPAASEDKTDKPEDKPEDKSQE